MTCYILLQGGGKIIKQVADGFLLLTNCIVDGGGDTHDGWLDFHRRKQQRDRKKLKKQYSKIQASPEIAEIVAPFASPSLELPPFDTINLDLLYENKAALLQLQKAIENKLMMERLARELRQNNDVRIAQEAADDELLLHIASLI